MKGERRGPIGAMRVSGNGRHFVDRAGKPVFWLGDTEWELFRMFTREEARELLRIRKAQGFNAILVMLAGVPGGNQAPAECMKRGQAWMEGGELRPKEEYFEHVDEVIGLGEETGQVFVVGVYHKSDGKVITEKNARGWARWVAKRYREAPNLIWCMYPEAKEEFIAVCRELAAGLREGDGGAHLISVHPDPSVASSSFMHGEEWLAFNMIQTCLDYDRIAETVRADYERKPVKPVVLAEGGYEGVEFGRLQTAHHIRKQAYWTQLAGGYHVYGHNDNWMTATKWKEWVDSPGAESMKVFKEIMTSCEEWWEIVPDQSIIVEGARGGFELNLAARAGSGRWAMVYVSEPSKVSVRLDGIRGSGKARAQWIDPRNGERKEAGTLETKGVGEFTTPAGWEDAVLFIEDRCKM